MNEYLFDTDLFSLFLQSDVNVVRSYVAHLFDHISVSIITIQEVWDGWAAAISRAKTPDQIALGYSRITGTLNELHNWTVTSYSVGAIARYAALKKQKLNVGSNDLKIAAIALGGRCDGRNSQSPGFFTNSGRRNRRLVCLKRTLRV